jgi:hypothetical protein
LVLSPAPIPADRHESLAIGVDHDEGVPDQIDLVASIIEPLRDNHRLDDPALVSPEPNDASEPTGVPRPGTGLEGEDVAPLDRDAKELTVRNQAGPIETNGEQAPSRRRQMIAAGQVA